MVVTSGLRSMEDHLCIYREKAAKEGVAFDESKVPKKSLHLFGAAVDIWDPHGELMDWCVKNEKRLEQIQLWVEAGTRGWVHFQIYAPNSGKRFFKP